MGRTAESNTCSVGRRRVLLVFQDKRTATESMSSHMRASKQRAKTLASSTSSRGADTGTRAPALKRPRNKATLAKSGTAYHHGNLREALIEFGIHLLDTEGVDNMSLRSAARLAGVSQAAPKNHFGDKEGLLAAIAARGFELCSQKRLELLKGAVAPEEKLRAVIRGYVEFAIERSALFNIMYGPAIQDRKHYPELEAAANRSYELLLSAVQAVNAKVSTSKRARNRTMLAIWCAMHGLANLACNHHRPPRFDESSAPVETLCDELCSFILSSLKS
jgi:AcrR family transcriptional regulator